MKNIYIISLRKIMYCMVFMAAGAGWLSAQTKPALPLLSGRVTDTFGNPIAGAEVRVEDNDNATVTDVLGNFELPVNGTNVILECSHTGFTTVKIPKGSSKSVDISLQKDISNKDRVIR